MLRNFPVVIFISICIAGCATKPVEPDNSPLNPTAVIERQVTNNGIKGFFPFETTEKDYVRSNMRRDESTFKGTGTFSGFIVGTHAGTKITRIDRKLQWALDADKEEYTECPLKGCVEPSHPSPRKGESAKQPEAQHEPGCTMRIAHTSFTVTPTGKKKSINGFDTDQYQIAWVVSLRDKAARTTTSTLNLDIWTTPLTQPMRDAMATEAAYARAFSGSVPESGKPQIIPADAARLISSYIASSLNAGDYNAFLDAGRQLEKIKGYPILTNLAWNMAGNACAPKEAENKPSRSSPPTSSGGLVSGLAGMFAEKKTEEAMKGGDNDPILSFTLEVKSLKVEPVRDSMFTVPANYKLVKKP